MPLFSYSSEPDSATPQHLLPSAKNATETTSEDQSLASNGIDSKPKSYLTTAADRARASIAPPEIPDSALEGYDDDPSLTKVVDRRWYERNKHLYPASRWEDFDPEKDYSKAIRKDGLGNSFFFSR